MDEQDKERDEPAKEKKAQHAFLAFETLPFQKSKLFKVQEAIVEPNLFHHGPAKKNGTGNFLLRLVSNLLFFAVLLVVIWLGYRYYITSDLHKSRKDDQLEKLTLNQILADKELTEYTLKAAAPLFAAHCADCHGPNGEGHQTDRGLFAPVLNDNDWIFENHLEDLYITIANGSQALMPAFNRTLSAEDLDHVARYVKALSEGRGAQEPVGRGIFSSAGCTDCHGESATGSQSIGAVNLTDSIWRFEGTLDGIRRTIAYGVNSGDPNDRTSTMPSFAEGHRLNPADIKKLAIYVSKLPEITHNQATH